MTLRGLSALTLQTGATPGRRICLGGVLLLPAPPSDSELIDAAPNELRWNNAVVSCLEKLRQALVGAKQSLLFDGKSGCRRWTASSASPCDRLGRRLRVSGGTEMDRGERHYKHFILCTIALQLSIVTVWIYCCVCTDLIWSDLFLRNHLLKVNLQYRIHSFIKDPNSAYMFIDDNAHVAQWSVDRIY